MTARTSARVTSEVARVAAALEDDALLERAAAAHIAFGSAARVVAKGPAMASLDAPSRNPAYLWGRRLIQLGRFRDAYRLLTESASELFPHLPALLASDMAAATTAAKFVAAVEADLLTAADHLRLSRFLAQAFASEADATAHLDRVRPRFPSNVTLHVELVRLLARRQEWERAFKVAKAGLDGASRDDPGRERLVLLTARLASLAGTRESGLPLLKAEAACRSPARTSHWAEAHAAAGDLAGALALYLRAVELGESPDFQIATLRLLRGEHEEALRLYNRSLRGHSRTAEWPPAEELPPSVPEFNLSVEQARQQILEKLGPDYFIDRLVARHAGAVTADDDAQVAKLLKRLESGSEDERMAARDAMRKLDSRMAPVVSKGLKSADEWTKIVVREILSEWAEPR